MYANKCRDKSAMKCAIKCLQLVTFIDTIKILFTIAGIIFLDIMDRTSEHQAKLLSDSQSFTDGPLLHVSAPMIAGNHFKQYTIIG